MSRVVARLRMTAALDTCNCTLLWCYTVAYRSPAADVGGSVSIARHDGSSVEGNRRAENSNAVALSVCVSVACTLEF